MDDLSVFDFDEQPVRIVMRDGEPWFVAADVCRVLGIANSRDAVARLDDDEKGVADADTLGGVQRVTVVSESGLYALVFTSVKPEAKRFRKWVTQDVLPALRRRGVYQVPGRGGPAMPDGVTDREVDQWLDMIRQARILAGKAAARRLWALSPLPDLAPPPEIVFGAEGDEIAAFLSECYIVTGQAEDFVRSRELIDAFLAWQERNGLPRMAERSISLGLAALAGVYHDPASGLTYRRAKSSATGYRGLRPRAVG